MQEQKNKVRFSDEELAEFKALIQAKMEKSIADLNLLKESFANDKNPAKNRMKSLMTFLDEERNGAYLQLCSL